MEKITDTSYYLEYIKDNDNIPVGGNALRGGLSSQLSADSDGFRDFFDTVRARAEDTVNNPAYMKWVDGNKGLIKTSPELYAHLTSFTQAAGEMYPGISSNVANRMSFYKEGKPLKLSQARDNGIFACAEYSMLAQLYLQSAGIKSRFFNGEVLWDKNHEFSEDHAFIIIDDNGEDFIFDPANPVQTADGPRPSVFQPQVTDRQMEEFNKKMAKSRRKVGFFEARNMLTGGAAYYGYGDRANVPPGHVIGKE
ncbi:MAG: hypothetical protein FWF01_00480 [Alphaproteobacteria bacterium]|nr:hypothetical protein [Alphaproteobacteria bacterium]